MCRFIRSYLISVRVHESGGKLRGLGNETREPMSHDGGGEAGDVSERRILSGSEGRPVPTHPTGNGVRP